MEIITMRDDFSLYAPGFVHRDKNDRKFAFHYASARYTLLDQTVAIKAAMAAGEHPYEKTLEGKFFILDTGTIQFNEHGFHTENLLGHRVQWRMQVFLGQAIRPDCVSGYTREWLFNHV